MQRYPFPWDRFAGLVRDLPVGRRSLFDDCRTMMSRVDPVPIVRGAESIPANGPIVVAANHYQRRGLWIAWPGAAIIVAVGERRNETLTWLVTGGLRWQQWRAAGPEIPGTRRLFRRVADTYGMIALPLIGEADRAAALRAWLRRAADGRAVGVFPEGLSGRSDGLRSPEKGFDALCRVLGKRTIPVLPTGIFEQDGILHVCFGQPRIVGRADDVMTGIAEMLPAHLQATYVPTSEHRQGRGPLD